MKILLITMEYPPDRGGVGNYYFNLVKNLKAAEVEVFKVNKNHFFKYFWPRWLKLFFELKKLVKKEKIDLIWVGQVLPIGEAAYLIKKLYKIPYFVSAHGMDIMVPQKKLRKETIMRKVLEQADFITANSQFTKTELLNLSLPDDKIEVIYPCPNYLPESNQKPDLDLTGKKVLLTVGRLVKRKGQDLVIEVLQDLVKEFPNLVYLIIGDGPEKEKYFNKENVILLDNISDQELPGYYRLADIFVMPSRQIGGDVEGFGLVYLEAAIFNLPVIAGRSGGIGEAVLDNQTGLLVDPENKDDLTEKIRQILNNEDLGVRLSLEAKKRVEKDFQWPVQADKLREKIKGLTGG